MYYPTYFINTTPQLSCYFSLTDEMPFSISRRPGEGAFGNVMLVLHKPTGRAFALKCQGKQAIVANELQVTRITENSYGSVCVFYSLTIRSAYRIPTSGIALTFRCKDK